jgi:hypothetical protein
VNKPAGDVQLAANTDVIVNGNAGGNNLQLIRGNIDLNGRNFEWGGTGNLQIDAGLRQIFSATPATFRVTGGNRAVQPTNGGTLSFNNQTIVQIAAGLDFGANTTTVNATLQINAGGFVNPNAPSYGNGSFLIYNIGGIYNRNVEWGNNPTIGNPGYPWHVIVQNGTTLDLNTNSIAPTTLSIAGDLTIGNGNTPGRVYMNNNMAKRLVVNGNLLLGGGTATGSELALGTVDGGDLEIGGNYTRIHNNNFIANNRAIFFTGTSNSEVNAPSPGPELFPLVFINKQSSGQSVTLNSPVKISNRIDFGTGILNTSATNLLTVETTANMTGGSLNSFANGPVAKETATGHPEFTYPLGKTASNSDTSINLYRPVNILLVGHSGTTTYEAEFFYETFNFSPPRNDEYVDPILKGIWSNQRWEISKSGSGTARVGLHYVPDQDSWHPLPPLNNGFNVAVARFNPSPADLWDFTPPPGASFADDVAPLEARNVASSGIVYSVELNTFSPFTFGFGFNSVLPLRLLSFTAALHGADALLHWTLDDAADLKHFEVEHSTNGQQFNRLDMVAPNGGTDFNYRHPQLPKGVHYYRLRMVQKDGAATYSQVAILMVDAQKTIITGLKQNPVVGGQARIGVFSQRNQQAEAVVLDMAGRMLLRQKITLMEGYNEPVLSVLPLPAAMYKLLLRTDDGVQKTMTMLK